MAIKNRDKPMLALRLDAGVLAHLRRLAAQSRLSQTEIVERLIREAHVESVTSTVRGGAPWVAGR